MEKAEILEKIKSFFFKEDDKKENYEEQEDDTPQTTDWKAGDKIIRVEGEVVVGSPIGEVTEMGIESLENGDYTIEDANMVISVEDGLISAITELEAPVEEETSEETIEESFESEETEFKFSEEDLTSLKSEIGTIVKEAFESLTGELEAIKKENEELKTKFETFSNEDSDKSVTEGKEKKIKFEDKYEKLRYFGKR